MSLRFFLLLAVLGLGAGCSRPAPVTVRDAPADRIMVVEDSTRQDGGARASDVVSVTVRAGGNWRTERFFVRGQALVYVFDARAGAATPSRSPLAQGEFSTEATLRTIREFVSASRSRWFAYRGRVRPDARLTGAPRAANDGRLFDFYEGVAAGGAATGTKGMRMYVNRANGLLEYQECDRDDRTDIKAIAYFGYRKLPAGLFNPGDTRVRSFEFLDRQIVLRYENLQVYEATMLPHGAAGR